MTDRALNDRLRQKSRRAGLAVGLSMLLTIAVCLGTAALIYAALVPYLSDIVPVPAPAAQAPAVVNPASVAQDVEEQSAQLQTDGGPNEALPADAVLREPDPAPTPTPEPEPTAEPTPTQEAFEPTHQVDALQSVNLRGGPNGQIIRAIPIAAPLRYLDETGTGSDGQQWMRFETEDGDEGWLRSDLVRPFEP